MHGVEKVKLDAHKTCIIRRAFPANIYLFKGNDRNTRKRCEIYSKLTIKTPERRQWQKPNKNIWKTRGFHCQLFINVLRSNSKKKTVNITENNGYFWPFFDGMKMKMKKMSYWLREKRCYYSLQQQNSCLQLTLELLEYF